MDSIPNRPALTVSQCATLACLLEVAATKPGNVHRAADFEDIGFLDFAVSSVAIGPAMATACQQGVGQTVLDAARATRQCVQSNTNLGTILLLAPLAAVDAAVTLSEGLPQVLAQLSPTDSAAVYQAIRLANPAGMGAVNELDVADEAPAELLSAMRLAADRDLVARQYINDFQQVFHEVAPRIIAGCQQGLSLTEAIVDAHLRLMAQHPDSLIARKCGQQIAAESAQRAARVIDAGQPNSEAYHTAAADLDFWLRADGHRRNPGTSADLIAAGLFVALREQQLTPPFR